MPYTSKQVANEFLELAKRDGRQLTPMQLQKLVYFAYGWYLAITGERLLNERIQAWQWGPVVPSLYGALKIYGSGPITEPTVEPFFEETKMGFRVNRISSDDPQKDDFARRVVAKVWETYGRFNGIQLSSITHAPNSPWSAYYDKDVRGTDIPDEAIAEYFKGLGAAQHDRPVAVS